MSCCLPKNQDFINGCKRIASKFTWSDDIKCHYDASFYNNRDYVLEFTVDGTSVPAGLKQALKEIGAVNIIGKVRKAIARNYVDLAFDLKVQEVKFDDYSDLLRCLSGSSVRHPSAWEAECALEKWFEMKVKIYVAGERVTYTQIIQKLLPNNLDDVYCKKMIESESK